MSAIKAATPVPGACNCGGVTFEVHGDMAGIFVCHCSICRRATGSNGIAVLIVANEDFCWTRGEELVRSWRKPGHDWESWFCTECGARVPGSNDPERMFIPAGSLGEAADSFRVQHHIWVDSRAAWDEIGDSGVQHSQEMQVEAAE
jgi:hypothetical protein